MGDSLVSLINDGTGVLEAVNWLIKMLVSPTSNSFISFNNLIDGWFDSWSVGQNVLSISQSCWDYCLCTACWMSAPDLVNKVMSSHSLYSLLEWNIVQMLQVEEIYGWITNFIESVRDGSQCPFRIITFLNITVSVWLVSHSPPYNSLLMVIDYCGGMSALYRIGLLYIAGIYR